MNARVQVQRRVAVALLLLLSACSWFARKPTVTPAEMALAADVARVEPASAARAACSNYDALIRESPFPRDATIRGIDTGKASVVFAVDGTRVTVLSVTSSAPVFGDAADVAVRKLACMVDRPTRFSMAFAWRVVR